METIAVPPESQKQGETERQHFRKPCESQMLMPDDYNDLRADEVNRMLLAEFQAHQANQREWLQLRDELTNAQAKWRSRDRRLGRIILIAMCLTIITWALQAALMSSLLAAVVIVSTGMRLVLAMSIRRRVGHRMNELAAKMTARSGRPPADSMFTPASPA